MALIGSTVGGGTIVRVVPECWAPGGDRPTGDWVNKVSPQHLLSGSLGGVGRLKAQAAGRPSPLKLWPRFSQKT